MPLGTLSFTFILCLKLDGNFCFINVILTIIRHDHSSGQKGTGNNVGGHFRCSCCGASFSVDDQSALFHFAEMIKAPKKDLQSQVLYILYYLLLTLI